MIFSAYRYLPHCQPAIYWPEPIRDPWASSRNQDNFSLLNRSVPPEIGHIRSQTTYPREQISPSVTPNCSFVPGYDASNPHSL